MLVVFALCLSLFSCFSFGSVAPLPRFELHEQATHVAVLRVMELRRWTTMDSQLVGFVVHSLKGSLPKKEAVTVAFANDGPFVPSQENLGGLIQVYLREKNEKGIFVALRPNGVMPMGAELLEHIETIVGVREKKKVPPIVSLTGKKSASDVLAIEQPMPLWGKVVIVAGVIGAVVFAYLYKNAGTKHERKD